VCGVSEFLFVMGDKPIKVARYTNKEKYILKNELGYAPYN
jgi:hypothetical protein